MRKSRRRFSREFKLEAVRQLTSGRQLAQVARELGVDAQVIRRWKDQVVVDAATASVRPGMAAAAPISELKNAHVAEEPNP